ncbi:MAG TPA: MopE-related protein [Polyangia bacterium]|nr:MopE-related protein [Polyangia bacterium]
MTQRRGFSLVLGVLGGLALGDAQAQPQPQVRGRMMVLVDTSGPMLWHFTDNLSAGGDGDLQSSYTDGTQADRNFYPGTPLGGGRYDGMNSRLYAAKSALSGVVNSSGTLDLGLMRFAPASTCPNGQNCCDFSGALGGACICQPGYVDNAGAPCNPTTSGRITWQGGCGPKANNQATNGGQVLVPPGMGSSLSVLQWVDNKEDFRDNGQGFPRNGELRAAGPAPLAGSVRTALNNWYQPIYSYTRSNPGCDPAVDPRCDPQIDCRPYTLVLMTASADTCEGCNQTGGCPQVLTCTGNGDCPSASCNAGQCACASDTQCPANDRCVGGVCRDARQLDNPSTVAQQLYLANPQNPVTTYVIGLGVGAGDPAADALHRIAAAGGTGTARLARSLPEVETALAGIAAAAVRYEICNNRDDDCDGVTDEGYDRGVTCTVGVGACLRTGVRKCDATGQGTTCCVDDGNLSGPCTPLQPGPADPNEYCFDGIDNNCNGLMDELCSAPPVPEVCNGLDDDLNGLIDDNLTDVGRPCGPSVGECRPGTTVCTNGQLLCQGGVPPTSETCNNKDDDCDGVVDAVTLACYGGPAGTENVGVCHGGQQRCVTGTLGACMGEVRPGTEVCNGLDDDCNGRVDDAPGTGGSCCPSGLCGVGQCRPGSLQCAGSGIQCVGTVGPTQEICDGIDNDCNGQVDDLPGIGAPCSGPFNPDNGCSSGRLACGLQQQRVVCVQRTPREEVCDGEDNDCDGSIDESPEVTQNDPRLGQACSDSNQQSPRYPCKLGTTLCRQGQVVCEGEVVPTSEVCDFQDNDCDGVVDDGASAACPTNYECRRGICITRCRAGDFPCPGGYTCAPDGYCYPSTADCNPPCAAGFTCRARTCIDNCAGRTCRPYEICDRLNYGSCVDNSCRTRPEKGCPPGETCRYDVTTDNYTCGPDTCAGVTCAAGQFCDPTDKRCRPACLQPCQESERCINGRCEADPCFGKSCPVGKSCDPVTAQCVTDDCSGRTCAIPSYQTCYDGACQVNPCLAVVCPSGTQCVVSSFGGTVNCEASRPPPRDGVTGLGGGGFSCAVSGPRASGDRGGRGAMTLLGGVLLVLWSRRWRSRRRPTLSG